MDISYLRRIEEIRLSTKSQTCVESSKELCVLLRIQHSKINWDKLKKCWGARHAYVFIFSTKSSTKYWTNAGNAVRNGRNAIGLGDTNISRNLLSFSHYKSQSLTIERKTTCSTCFKGAIDYKDIKSPAPGWQHQLQTTWPSIVAVSDLKWSNSLVLITFNV